MDERILAGKRVLVIEDEMLVLMTIEDMLGDLGCTSIGAAADIETALASLAENTFDLATLDLNLNGERSYAIAEALNVRHIPFAFATGYGEHGVDKAYGDHPVLTKPFSHFQFNHVIRCLMTDEVGLAVDK